MEFDEKRELDVLIDLQSLAQKNLGKKIIDEKLSCLSNRYGVYECFCNESYYIYQKDNLINHLSICSNLNEIIQNLKKKLLNYNPLDDFKRFLKSYDYKNLYSSENYIEDDELSGFENDILYYIHKYECLSGKELIQIFRMDYLDSNKILTNLYNLGHIDRYDYGRSYMYFHNNSKPFENRKNIIRILVKKSIELKIPKIKTYHLLKEAKICFDMQIINECIKEIEYDIIMDLNIEDFVKKDDIINRNNLKIALPKMKSLIQKLNVPENVMQDAVKIYMITLRENLLMGRSMIKMVTASLYCALKIHRIPQTINEIISIDNIKKSSFMKTYQSIIKIVFPILKIKTQAFTPEDYIIKFCNQLKISSECKNDSKILIGLAKNQNLVLAGKDPRGFAAASIYIASKARNEWRTQKEIVLVAKITEVTLRQRVKDLKKFIT